MKKKKKNNEIFDTNSVNKINSESLGEKLRTIISNLPPDSLTLREIRDLLGQDGMLLFTVFLTLVFLIPVSIPGVSTIFGAAILLVGACRLFNQNLWLPRRFLDKQLPSDKLRNSLSGGLKWFNKLEKLSRSHRLQWLTKNSFITAINNLSMILGAILLMMPFGLIPFSNTLPALALLFFAIGILQKDGVCILLGHLSNIATIIYFGVLISGSGLAIHSIFKHFAG